MNKKFRVNKGFIFQKIGKKISIYDGEESMIYTLNETASYIFLKIKKGLNIEEIIGLLVQKYTIPSKKAAEDVEDLMKEMKRRSILLSEKNRKPFRKIFLVK